MVEPTAPQALPQATLVPKRRRGPSLVWLIPMVAAAVASGIAVNRIMNEGPTIAIEFGSVEGVEAGKTVIKYKDVNIGQVTGVELTGDYKKVQVTAKMAKSAEGLMVDDARFWVVQPRVTLSGVSGLGTLLSGNYIGFEPGQSHEARRRFTGLDVAPVLTTDQPGRKFTLSADDLGSLGVGSPIYFRRIQAGEIVSYDLSKDGKSLDIRVFVQAPYDQFVTTDTRFWNASGIDISLGTSGVDVRTQSLVSVLIGGVAFDSPPDGPPGAQAPVQASFTLYKDRSSAMKQPEAIARHYVLYTDGSLRGLAPGAPVTLLGLPGGEVTDVGLDADPVSSKLRGRIEIATYPERMLSRLYGSTQVAESVARDEERAHKLFLELIEKRGLRAQLRSGSLLTGKLYVALDFFPDAPPATLDLSQQPPVIPLVPAVLPDLETKVSGILAKIDALPFDVIGKDLKTAIETFNSTLKDLDKAIAHIDTGLTPEIKSTVADLRQAIGVAKKAIKDTDVTMLNEDAPTQLQLRDALQEVAGAARAIRVLSDYLERQPGSLIRGKTE